MNDLDTIDKLMLYEILKDLVTPANKLASYRFAVPESKSLTKRYVPKKFSKSTKERVCSRCKINYEVDDKRMQLPRTKSCFWHSKKFSPKSKTWLCCNLSGPKAPGCNKSKYHVHNGEFEPEFYEGYVTTKDKSNLEPNKHGIFILDCKWLYTTIGPELAHLKIFNHKLKVVYDEHVKISNPILDLNRINEDRLKAAKKTLVDI